MKLLWNILYENQLECTASVAGNENLTVKKTNQKTLMHLSNCAICGKKN